MIYNFDKELINQELKKNLHNKQTIVNCYYILCSHYNIDKNYVYN